MSLNVSFRVVGLYCFFENMLVDNVDENSTVKAVMDQIVAAKANDPDVFSYKPTTMGGSEIVDSLKYDFTSNVSQDPFNSTLPIAPGERELSNQIGNLGLVWQYYRSVTGSVGGGAPFEVKLLSRGQPSFANQSMNFNDPTLGSSVPDGFVAGAYNLTWRLVQIQMTPQTQAKFSESKINLMRS